MNRIDLDSIYNDNTVNIFSDASMCNDSGCYGFVAVMKDTILNQGFFPREHTTNNESEVLGIRLALSYALEIARVKPNITINIFSDSLITVTAILNYNNYTVYPVYDIDTDAINNYVVKNVNSGRPLANQSYFTEAMQVYKLLLDSNINIHIYYQPAHIIEDCRRESVLKSAIAKFTDLNKLDYIITLSYLMYISKYNDYVDNFTRTTLWSMLAKKSKDHVFYTTPIKSLHQDIPSEFFELDKSERIWN